MELTLSHSQVQAYNKCKQYWKLKYVDGWATVSTEAMNRGTLVHQLLNAYYTNPDAYREHVKNVLRTNENFDETSRIVRVVDRYVHEFASVADKNQVTLALEEKFEVEFKSAGGNLFKIQGYIDRIYMQHGKIYIEDFKSLGSASWWSQMAVLLDPQLTLYAALAPYITTLKIPINNVDGVTVTQLNCYEYKRDFEKKSIFDIVKRETAYRSAHEHAAVLVEFSNVADEMLSQLENRKPFTRSLSKSCEKCDFGEICMYAMRGLDTEAFLAARFEKKSNPLSLQMADYISD